MDNSLRFLRQADAVDMSRLTSLGVTLIGLGSIGSFTALGLGKIGVCGLQAWDADVVSPENVSCQLYGDDHIGMTKAGAMLQLMEQLGGHTPNATAQLYTDQPLTEVVISAVDSMSARKQIWQSVRQKPDVKLYIDSRMALQTLVVYCVRPGIREERVAYSQTIVPDSETLQEPCTNRSIGYTSMMAGSILTGMIRRYVNAEALPFRLVLDLATFTLMTD
ncbi:MAG TPA: ThiF family adenylyltransferase [bacterium]|jgi:hypothetical protein